MPDEPTNSPAPAVESAPATPSTAPADAFRDDMPNWVKADPKLAAAHDAATPKPGASPATPAVPALPAAVVPATPAATPGALPQFDERKLAELVTAGVRAAQPAPAPTPISDADMVKQLGIFTATPEIFEAIYGLKAEKPEQVRALNDAFQGVARQAVTISKLLHSQEIDKLRAEFSPYMNLIRESEASRQQELFYKEHTDLTGYDPIVRKVFAATMAGGQKFASVAEARKFVAEQSRELLKSAGVTPVAASSTPAAVPASRTTTPQSRPMSPTSMGGRNGGPGATKPTSTMESVWGNK